MSDERTYGKDTVEKYDRIIKVFKNFDPEGITILTGNNGSGKSLLRKQLPFAFRQYFGLDHVNKTKGMIASTSMEARTNSNPEWGALSGMMQDTEWIATSQNTFNLIHELLDAVEKGKSKYVVIDEYEIGCSEETILAIAKYISSRLKKMIAEKRIMGALIITHSRIGVKNIEHDHFVNMEGLSEKEWINRKIVPTDLDALDTNELFFYIRDRQK